jgi:predicted nucleic acid-binding protein
MNVAVVDASFALSFLLPDESIENVDGVFEDYLDGTTSLVAPTLLPYEVVNGIKSALTRKRIDCVQANQLASAFLALDLQLLPINLLDALARARTSKLSAYDASYVSLAASNGWPLLTHDKRLRKAVQI